MEQRNEYTQKLAEKDRDIWEQHKEIEQLKKQVEALKSTISKQDRILVISRFEADLELKDQIIPSNIRQKRYYLCSNKSILIIEMTSLTSLKNWYLWFKIDKDEAKNRFMISTLLDYQHNFSVCEAPIALVAESNSKIKRIDHLPLNIDRNSSLFYMQKEYV